MLGAIFSQNNKRQTLIPCNKGGYSDARIYPCSTRGGVNMRKWERIKLDKRKSIQDSTKQATERNIIKQVSPNAHYECAEAFLIPLEQVYTDTDKFQQRETEYSQDSVNKIISAVKNGTFQWAVLDPILLWKSPSDKLFVLSGHSRYHAFLQLAKAGITYNNRDFTRIPARMLSVPEDEAVRIALMSNTLSTPETPMERATFYRKLLQNTPYKEVAELAERYEAKNATTVLAFAYLNPNGMVMQMIRSTQNADAPTRKLAETVAQYIGEARRRHPYLNNLHEKEMWDFMQTTEGQKAIKTKGEFLSAITKAVEKNTEFGQFNPEKPLNLLRTQYRPPAVQEYEKQLSDLKRQIDKAIQQRDQEFKRYLALGYKAQEINPVLKNYDAEISHLRRQYGELYQKRGIINREAEKQASIFGISTRFSNNTALVTGGSYLKQNLKLTTIPY
jgi:hypothetical protein